MSEDAEEDESAGESEVPEDADVDEMEELLQADPAAGAQGAGGMPGTHVRAMEFWDDIIADMEATADEYEEAGWETLQLHPGDVTTLSPDDDSDMFGLDVLVPNNEFDAVEAHLEDDVSFDAYEAYRATGEGLVLLVVAMEDHDAEVAVLYPTYYDPSNAQAMLTAAERAGEMRTYLRTLTNERIEFTHDEPANFGPPTAAGSEDAE